MSKVKILDKTSLTLRNLTRHKIAPGDVFFIDRKRQANKERCRRRED